MRDGDLDRQLVLRDDARVRFVELDGEPCRIVDEWRDAPVAWVVDAMASGREPGTVAEIDPDALPSLSASTARGSHAAGVADAIALGRVIGALPRRLRVFGVEGTTFGPGPGLSLDVAGPRLTAAADHLDHRLRGELQELRRGGGAGHDGDTAAWIRSISAVRPKSLAVR
jgi:hydrogenase maturation protease